MKGSKKLAILAALLLSAGGLAPGCDDGECDDGQVKVAGSCVTPGTDGGPSGRDSGPGDGDGGTSCDSVGACVGPAKTFKGELQAYVESEVDGCDSLTWNDGLAAMAHACALMMAEAGRGEACQGTSETRAQVAGVANDFEFFAETSRSAGSLDVVIRVPDGLLDEMNRYYLDQCIYTDVGVGIAGDELKGYWLVTTYGDPPG